MPLVTSAATTATRQPGDAAGQRGDAPIAVVAFGGNALLKRGEPPTMETQQRNAQGAAAAVRQLVEAGFRVCVTHGNGPQVGMLALQDPKVGAWVLLALLELLLAHPVAL